MSDISIHIAKLSPEQRTLLKSRIATKHADSVRKIPRRKNLDSFPLSFAQESLWIINQLDPGPHYNDYTAFRLTGSLNVVALEQAMSEIVRRHEVLRSTFITVEGRPVQVITPASPLAIPVTDLRGEPESEAHRLAREEAQCPFNLTRETLLRAKLLWIGESDYLLLLTMHHIVTDGWSMSVFIREMGALYEAFSSGKPSPLPELLIQYADYAEWQRAYLQGDRLEKQLSYWKERLDRVPMLELPTDRPRPPVQTFRGARYYLELPKALTKSLRELSQREDVTLFMVLLTAFKVLLSRYSGQDDFCVGTPVAGRNQPEVQGLVGFFVNTLVLRTNLSGNPSFRELLERVRETTLEAFAHQELPFVNLVKELRLERTSSYTPLFQVMFSSQPPAPTSVEGFSGLTIGALDPDNQKSAFDLALQLTEGVENIHGRFQYNTDLFDAASIERMLGHYRTLLEGIVAHPDTRLSELPLLTAAEQHQVIAAFNETGADYPTDVCVHECFEQQAARRPDAVAVNFEDAQLTYADLNRRANQLAHRLRTLGVGPEVLVGICTERSLEWVVGLLGILKAGGAYVSLDPTYPKDRLAFMMKDTQVPVLVTQQRLIAGLPEHRAEVVRLDSDWESIAQEREENLERSATAENLAYVVYTSGSTGKPKAAVINHRSLVNLVFWHLRNYEVTSADRALQIARMGFGAAVWEVWSYLTTGASIHILDEETRVSPSKLKDWLLAKGITIGFLPPVLAEGVLYKEWSKDVALRAVLTGSDKLLLYPPESLPFKYVNHYGMTEATVVATSAEVLAKPEAGPAPLIGRPLANIQIYLLDRYLQPVPVKVPGELYIGGDGLARGYLNRLELTAEKFIPNPFSQEPGTRLYRTGDLARYRPDGNIEFLGRIDFQVKIRGYRIELGEIETVLCQHPVIEKAVVALKEDASGEKQLVAYIVSDSEQISVNEVRNFLKENLPEYMVPAAFIMLDEMPLTPNNKVDRRALPEPEQSMPKLVQAYVAPRNPTEEVLAGIWSEVLGVERVGVHDDFIQLGGHSLVATQLISRVRDAFEVNLPVRSIFERPTIMQFSELIEEVLIDEIENLTQDEAIRYM